MVVFRIRLDTLYTIELLMATNALPQIEQGASLVTAAPFLRFIAQWYPRFPSVGVRVYLELWQRIVSGQWPAGVPLLDVQICDDLGTSRTPVREALHRLVQEGLVEKVPQRGFQVVTLSAKDVVELYDTRTALEMMATRLSAPGFNPRVLAQLQAATERLLGDGVGETTASFLEVDVGLHVEIMNVCANKRLQQAYATLLAQVGLFQVSQAAYKHARVAALEEHVPIIEALRMGDSNTASEAMFRHIQDTKIRILHDVYGCS